MESETLAAWWGSITGTLALGWEILRWYGSGPKLKVRAVCDMQILQGSKLGEESYVSVSVRNVGDQPTTITHFMGKHFPSWFSRYVQRRGRLFAVIPGPEGRVPHLLGPGETWAAMVIQSEVESLYGGKGSIFIGVQHSMSEKPALVKLVMPRGTKG